MVLSNVAKMVTLARKVLGFKCAIVRPLTFLGHYPIVLWKNTIYPLMCWFVNYSWELYLASIQLIRC